MQEEEVQWAEKGKESETSKPLVPEVEVKTGPNLEVAMLKCWPL